MGKRNDRLMDFLAGLIARFLVGFGGSFVFLLPTVYLFPELWVRHWKIMSILSVACGVFYAIFGLRKGPGVI